jgi:hypothetical protein
MKPGLRRGTGWFSVHRDRGAVADLAFGVFAADAVGFLLGFPLVAPVSTVAALE